MKNSRNQAVFSFAFCIVILMLGLSGCSSGFESIVDTEVSTSYTCDPSYTTYDEIGSGTLSSPYIICTAAQFVSIGKDSTSWNKHFKLGDDITLTAYDQSTVPLTVSPIGIYDSVISANTDPFTGTFNGNSKTIANITMTAEPDQSLGLFGYTDGASIKDLSVLAVDYDGDSYMGALVGVNKNTPISNVDALGSIDGTGSLIGGLVGYNDGSGATSDSSISNSSANVAIQGESHLGGLIGANSALTGGTANITNCNAQGNIIQVSAGDWVGGLIGHVTADTAGSAVTTSSLATGNVTLLSGGGAKSGTFIGEIETEDADTDVTVSESSSSGNLTGDADSGTLGHSGGFIGNYVCTDATCIIEKSSSTSDVTITDSGSAPGNIGGLVGYVTVSGADGTFLIRNSYYNGSISTEGTGGGFIGGLIGGVDITTPSTSTVTNCYVSTTILPTSGSYDPEVGAILGGLGGGLVAPTFSSVYFNSDPALGGYATGSGAAVSTVTGKTPTQMKLQAMYTAWNFTTTWTIVSTVSFPTLR